MGKCEKREPQRAHYLLHPTLQTQQSNVVVVSSISRVVLLVRNPQIHIDVHVRWSPYLGSIRQPGVVGIVLGVMLAQAHTCHVEVIHIQTMGCRQHIATGDQGARTHGRRSLLCCVGFVTQQDCPGKLVGLCLHAAYDI